ncbi:YqaA family protein [Chromobacterium violaceum]|uniref:YqaA family protein n=1 Tax=Chromobacterium violaceum TaxID=536 RepID=UPI0005D363AF|nr:YqaA family protein [Chromobacterium violaceum]KJH65665.1 membrane protein [Chromobacterium violaceum]MBA8737080.1 DedA family protein [Chromobacterium violaceum]MCD0491153.1 DedA family protein [Chromobacterium violaceum]
MEGLLDWLLGTLALPKVGLSAIFMISLVSATLLPLGSEPAVFAYIKLRPDLFWQVIAVATLGNTLGGIIDWWMGYGAKVALLRYRLRRSHRAHAHPHAESTGRPSRSGKPTLNPRYFRWMRQRGAPMLLLSWLPGIGDPLCTLAGWLRIPFWPSVCYMAIGKCLRYVLTTAALLWVPDDFWRGLGQWF